MSQYVFGTGQLFAMPVGGGAPLRFGALQDVSVDISADTKQLHGQYQYALDTARGKSKIEFKAGTGNIDVNAFNTLFFGETVDAGGELIQQINEPGTVPTTPFQITVAHAADFVMDLGVYNSVTGDPYTQVASAPAAGQYSVSALGVYTFNTADAADTVLINYMWEDPASGGSMTLSNQLMGQTPRFQLVLANNYANKNFGLILYSAVADKLSLPLKQDDYLIAELSGSAFANDAGNVARITTTSIAGGGG